MSRASAEWRHGWPVAGSALIAMSIGTFAAYTHGTIGVAIGREFGWTRLQLSMSVTLVAFAGAIVAPLVGRAADRFGARPVALAGLATAFFGYAQLPVTIHADYRSYLVAWTVAALCCAPANVVIWTLGVARSFAASRGLALAVALSGTGLMGGLQSIAGRLLVDAYGWRVAYAVLACASAGLTALVALPWFRPPAVVAAPSTRPDRATDGGLSLRQALRTRRFWTLAIILVCTGGPLAGLFVNLVQIYQERGIPPLAAASLLGVSATTVITARLVTGLLLDRVHGAILACLAFVCAAAAMLALLFLPGSVPAAVVAALLFGVAAGAEFDLIGYLSSRYFGLRQFGAIYGLLFGILAVAQGVSPMLIGWGADAAGGYRAVLAVVAACYAAGALLSLSLGRYPREFASTPPSLDRARQSV